MPTNSIVNPYRTVSEQRLLDDLNVEAIQHRGLTCYYVPRVEDRMDRVTLEDPMARFEEAVEVEVYIRSFEGFQGDGHFMDKLGVTIKDQVLLTIAATTFLELVGTARGFRRPREGDLLFFPFSERLFEIMFVDKFTNFFPLGALQVYDLRCEVFEYSGQIFTTGIPEIDEVQPILSMNLLDRAIATEDGLGIMTEGRDYWVTDDWTVDEGDPLDDRDDIQDESDAIEDFTETDPFSEGLY